MPKYYHETSAHMTANSKYLRTHMTPEEKHLWYDFLKKLPITVYRQHVIGSYIADFYVADPPTVIELDGSQHYRPDDKQYDGVRNEYMRANGITVLRFSNLTLHDNFSGVCLEINKHLFPS